MATPSNNAGIKGAAKVTVERPERDQNRRNRQRQIAVNSRVQERVNNEDFENDYINESSYVDSMEDSEDESENSTEKLIGILNRTNNRVKLIHSVIRVVWLLIYLYLAQLAFALMSLAFIVLDGTTGLGESIFWVGHIIAMVLGLMSSAIMFGTLMVSRTNFLHGKKIIYMLTIILHVAPILNLLPLVGIWFFLLLLDAE